MELGLGRLVCRPHAIIEDQAGALACEWPRAVTVLGVLFTHRTLQLSAALNDELQRVEQVAELHVLHQRQRQLGVLGIQIPFAEQHLTGELRTPARGLAQPREHRMRRSSALELLPIRARLRRQIGRWLRRAPEEHRFSLGSRQDASPCAFEPWRTRQGGGARERCDLLQAALRCLQVIRERLLRTMTQRFRHPCSEGRDSPARLRVLFATQNQHSRQAQRQPSHGTSRKNSADAARSPKKRLFS
jgi:hypothetical protein